MRYHPPEDEYVLDMNLDELKEYVRDELKPGQVLLIVLGDEEEDDEQFRT